MADRPADDADPSLAEHPADEHAPRFWRELPILLILALAIAILLKTFLVQAFYIPSISMSPTLEKGDRILVCRICVRVGGIDRGDVIVFSDPHPGPGVDRGPIGAALHWLGEGIGVAQPENEDFIKRVVGLPGDVVELHDGTAVRQRRAGRRSPTSTPRSIPRPTRPPPCPMACCSCWEIIGPTPATRGSSHRWVWVSYRRTR